MRNDLSTLLYLLAMGSWVGSYSPPLDEDAPPAVGNAGVLKLEGDGEHLEFSLQPLRLYESPEFRLIRIEGEPGADGPGILLMLDVAELERLKDHPAQKVKETVAQGGRIVSGPWPEPVTVTSGQMTITSMTGTGPWELDADLALQTSQGPFSGRLQAQLV